MQKRILILLMALLLCLTCGCRRASSPKEETATVRARVTLGTWNYDENGYQLASAAMGSHTATDKAEYDRLKALVGGIPRTMTETDYTFLTGYLVELFAPDGSFESAVLVGTSKNLVSEDGLIFTCGDLSAPRAALSALLEANQ